MLSEYLFRYRMLKPWARVLILCVLGLLPGAWKYLDEADAVEAELEAATSKEGNARDRLAKVKGQVKDLAALEVKQQATQDQLKKAQSKLPNQVFVDEVLKTVSQYANQSDVAITKFEPVGNKLIDGDYPYNETRFKISMAGHYGNLGEWIDHVGGASSLIHVKNWNIARSKDNKIKPIFKGTRAQYAQEDMMNGWTQGMAEQARADLVLGLDTDITLYSVATPAQIAAAATVKVGDDKNKLLGKDPPLNSATSETKPDDAGKKPGGGT